MSLNLSNIFVASFETAFFGSIEPDPHLLKNSARELYFVLALKLKATIVIPRRARDFRKPNFSATLPAPDAPAHPRAGLSIMLYPRPAAAQTPWLRPPACRQWKSLVFQESCALCGLPVYPILPLLVG